MKKLKRIKVFILNEIYKDSHKFYRLSLNGVKRLEVKATDIGLDRFIDDCCEFISHIEDENTECTILNRIKWYTV